MDWPFCRFLLPPPETDHLDGMVCFQLPDQIVRLPIHLDFQINHPDCQELPYEFVAAKQTGMVMKRHHIYGSGPPSPEVHGEIFKEILDHGGDVILDVGCGIGPYTTALNKKGKRAFGLEINWDYVKMARENKVPVLHYDGEHIPFKTESFETVIAIEVLEHVEAWDRLLHEMLRVARKNILITTPNMDILSGMCKHHVVPWHLLEATHCNFFTPETWRHVIMNLPNVIGYVKTISPFYVNNELFDMQLFVNMVKETGF